VAYRLPSSQRASEHNTSALSETSLQLLRQALWDAYGPQVQQAWREQLVPDGPPPEFDPDEPF